MASTKDYRKVKGKASYENIETGEIISRRQWLKIKRGGISNEQFARMNRVTNAAAAEARPARGKKSLLKLSDTEREFIANARIEARAVKTEQRKEEQAKRALENKIKRIANRKPKKRKRVSGRLLKAGRLGTRFAFNTYEEYLEIIQEAKSTGVIKFYGLGMEGYHENTGEEYAITVFTLRTLGSPIPRQEFEDTFEDEIEMRAYFVFTNFFIHLAFSKDFARDKAKRAGLKWIEKAHVSKR